MGVDIHVARVYNWATTIFCKNIYHSDRNSRLPARFAAYILSTEKLSSHAAIDCQTIVSSCRHKNFSYQSDIRF